MTHDYSAALTQLDQAATSGQLSQSAVANIRVWLTEPRYVEYAPQVADHIAAGKWKELDDAFWTIIPFGTGGRRGRMYPIGSNAINDRTIGESAQGLADYVNEEVKSRKSKVESQVNAEGSPTFGLRPSTFDLPFCAIAYD